MQDNLLTQDGGQAVKDGDWQFVALFRASAINSTLFTVMSSSFH
jgi:hypothetical protein